MRGVAIAFVVVALASCFRGEFLAGTSCENDSECAPRYICMKDGGTTGGESTTGGIGVCGSPDYSPPPTSSDGTGTATSESGTSSATTGTSTETTGTTGG